MARQLTFQEDNSIVIGVIQQKGGVGKTSLLTNIAGVMSQHGNRLLLVDLDGQCNVASSFSMKPHMFSAYSMFEGRMPSQDLVSFVNPNINVIQGHEDLSMIELDLLPRLKNYDNPFNFVKKHIDNLRPKFDYVLLDSPPSLGMLVGNILATSDYIIVPFVPEKFCAEGLRRVVRAVREFQEAGHKVEILAVVPMLVKDRTRLHTKILQETRRYCYENNIYMTTNTIPHSIEFATAVEFDKLPATMSKARKSDIVKNYFLLWNELHELIKIQSRSVKV